MKISNYFALHLKLILQINYTWMKIIKNQINRENVF